MKGLILFNGDFLIQAGASLVKKGPLAEWLESQFGLPPWLIVLVIAPILVFILAYLLRIFILKIINRFEKRPNNRAIWKRLTAYAITLLGIFILFLIWKSRLEWISEDFGALFGKNAAETVRHLSGIIDAVLATIIFLFVVYLLKQGYRAILKRFEASAEESKKWRFQKIFSLSSGRTHKIIVIVLQLIRAVLILLLLYFYVPLMLSFFPATEVLADNLMPYVTEPSLKVIRSIVDYIPNLITIIVIVVAIKYILRFLNHLFKSLGKQEIKIRGFDPEWADQTRRLTKVPVILLGIVFVYPFLPGAGSEIFKGFSLFIGAVVTLGSTSAVNNVVSGIVLTYAGAFRIGDRVRIANTLGDVVEKKLFVTRIKTFENKYVTISNGQVLGGNIVNLSKVAKEEGIRVGIAAGISYDVDWRKVHKMMISAALETPGVLKDPEPFVLQTELGDYAVSYKVVCRTNEPQKVIIIESELRRNVMDKFNNEGIEIMSPAVTTLRESDGQMIPPEYDPKPFSFFRKK